MDFYPNEKQNFIVGGFLPPLFFFKHVDFLKSRLSGFFTCLAE